MPIVTCKICSKSFYAKPSHLKLGWGKYCSNACRSKSQLNGKYVKCFVCSKQIYRSNSSLVHSKSQKYFCSKKCQTLWRNSIYIEDRSPNWINGISSYRDIMSRKSLINECKVCGIKDKRILIIHHIDHNRKNNDVSNLVCLCLNCHFLVHHDENIGKRLQKAQIQR